MQKNLIILISPMIVFIILFLLLIINSFLNLESENYSLEIANVEKINFDSQNNLLTIKVTAKDSLAKPFTCTIFYQDYKVTVENDNNTCVLSFPIGYDYQLFLTDGYQKSPPVSILKYLSNDLEFSFFDDTIYLYVGETETLNYRVKTIDGQINSFKYDSSIIQLENNQITSLKPGTTTLTYNDAVLNIIVTDLITAPTIQPKNLLACNQYNQAENELMDAYLKYQVDKAGYHTRAGVVAAARFLTLQFSYRIPYFFENGRLNNTGVNYADGEGRYYHPGLYLNESKTSDVVASFSGPATWGCPLKNWEDEKEYGYISGAKMPNGLDCSGFVSWAILNGGYDIGDYGANILARIGNLTKITSDLLNSHLVKAGDIIHYNGHVGLIIGLNEDNIYVAEALQNYKGLVVNTYTKNNITNYFTHISLMDNYYQEEGNYTEFWS